MKNGWMNSWFAAWRREDSGGHKSCLHILESRHKQEANLLSDSIGIQPGPVGGRYKEADKKELSANCLQRENRLPKERIFSTTGHRQLWGRSRKTMGQSNREGHAHFQRLRRFEWQCKVLSKVLHPDVPESSGINQMVLCCSLSLYFGWGIEKMVFQADWKCKILCKC